MLPPSSVATATTRPDLGHEIKTESFSSKVVKRLLCSKHKEAFNLHNHNRKLIICFVLCSDKNLVLLKYLRVSLLECHNYLSIKTVIGATRSFSAIDIRSD